MKALSTWNRPREGFTLVEILVVIVIIGILAALLMPAIVAARNRAKVAVIRVDLSQLDMAMTSYKQKRTDYPPDFAGLQSTDAAVVTNTQNAVLQHLRKAFPRYVPGVAPGNTGTTPWEKLVYDVDPTGAFDLNQLTPASALVFWLGGLPDPGSKQLRGFSANPRNPFDPTGARLPKFFDFKETGLKGFDTVNMTWLTWPTYCADGTNVPYVYFRARRSSATGRFEYAFSDGTTVVPLSYTHPLGTVCVPYLAAANGDPTESNTVRRWNKPESFQIISPGLDERFGVEIGFRCSETGENFSEYDYDNVTNFSEGELEDEIEIP